MDCKQEVLVSWMISTSSREKEESARQKSTKKVEVEAGEVAKMKEACRKRKRILRVPLNWVSTYKDSKRATKKLKVVEKLQTEARSIVITRRLPSSLVQEIPTVLNVVGTESNVNEVLLCLDDDSGIIVIWGTGGIGKTTLLRLINNNFLPGNDKSSKLDHVIWTVASRECTLEKLQEGIAKRLGLNLEALA